MKGKPVEVEKIATTSACAVLNTRGWPCQIHSVNSSAIIYDRCVVSSADPDPRETAGNDARFYLTVRMQYDQLPKGTVIQTFRDNGQPLNKYCITKLRSRSGKLVIYLAEQIVVDVAV